MTYGGSALGSSALGSTAGSGVPAPSNLSIDGARPSAIDVSWTLNTTDESGVRLFLQQGSNSFTQVADLAPNTESYTLSNLDTDLLTSQTDYTVFATAYKSGVESTASNTDSTTTPTASLVGQMLTNTDSNPTGIPNSIFVFEDATGSQLATTYTDSDGNYAVGGIPADTYDITVRSYTYGSDTTTGVAIGSSSETTLDAELDGPSSDGSALRGQIYDLGRVVPHTDIEVTINGTDTTDPLTRTVRTGDAGEFVVFPFDDRSTTVEATISGQTILSSSVTFNGLTVLDLDAAVHIASISAGDADLTWTASSTADNFTLTREELDGGSYTNQTTISAGNSPSVTDDAILPETAYRWRLTTTFDDGATETTQWVLATTPTLGLVKSRIPSRGWYVDIAGRTPAISSVQLQPTVNGTPSMQLDLPRDETWQQDIYDDADVEVWRDAVKQPLDDLDSRELTPGSTSVTLSGGAQLGQRVVARSREIEPVADFVERLIDTHTSYTPVVDAPTSTIKQDVVLQDAATQSELQAAFNPIPDDLPLKWDGDTLVPLQTAYLFEGEAAGGKTVSDVSYSSGSAAKIDSGNSITFSFDLDYDIPDQHLQIVIRGGYSESSPSDPVLFDVVFDGVTVSNQNKLSDTLNWSKKNYGIGAVEAGSHTVTLEYNSGTDGFNIADVVGIVDRRYNYQYDNSVDSDNGHLDGPEPYPDQVPLPMDVIDTPLAVDTVTVSATTISGDTLPQMSLRDEGDGSYVTAADTLSTSITYDTLSPTVQGRVSVGRREGLSPRDQTPRLGYEPLKLDTVTTEADLDTTPILINRTFDEPLVDILREAMDVYDGAFEVREGDPTELHVSRIDGRPVDIDPDLSDTSVERDTSGAVDIAIVYAAAESITELPFTATQDQWEQLPLDEGRIVEQSETVRDGPNGTQLDRGDDYEIREVVEGGPPEIQLLTSVSDPHIDCRFKPRGYYEADDVPQYPDEIVRDAPELNSKQMADLAAYQAVEGAYTDATIDATVELPPGEIGFDVIDALNVADLPGDDPYQVRDVKVSPQRIRVRLGAGQTAGEAIQEIRDRTSRVSERV